MAFELPKRGLVFWPVRNGDSTTVAVDEDTYLQVDLNNLEQSDDDDATAPVVDELSERLPKVDGRAQLAVFALTHPDQDHCRGFSDLLSKVEIDELWFTPRIFGEYNKNLCDDAKAFKKEAARRVKKTIEAKGDPGAGDRVRIFGYSELLEDDEFKGFPAGRLTVPGTDVTAIAGRSVSDRFRAFVHAPFKDDEAGERNDTSLALQITLIDGENELRALLLGDLSYPILKRIFEVSDKGDLAWNVLLAPHHCSKSAMYWKDSDDDEEELKEHIVEAIEAASLECNRVISSSNTVPPSNEPGDNPPHAKAKTQYEGITESFLCTMDQDQPIVVEFENGDVVFSGAATPAVTASQAADIAKGTNPTPRGAHTYGRR